MALGTIKIGSAEVSRVVIGGNPFSGFSHQPPEKDREMVSWYTVAQIKEALRRAEVLGVNTHLGRADHHIMRMLREYWDEGGRIQWIAQTCPELGPIQRGVENAIRGDAMACYVHGGVMDRLFAHDQIDEVVPAIEMIKQAGLPAGIACHNPDVLPWAEDHLDLDFYMCSYYDSARPPTNSGPERVSGRAEWFRPEDRERMTQAIQGLSRPAIHYKVMAAGRNDPQEALDFVAEHLRPQDAICIGVFTRDHPDMLAEDARILEECLQARGKC